MLKLLLVFLGAGAELAQGAHVRGAMKGSGCIVGAQITAATGRTGQIRTSVQGANYDANDKCSWSLSGGDSPMASITLTFKSFDLEPRGQHTHKCRGRLPPQLPSHNVCAVRRGVETLFFKTTRVPVENRKERDVWRRHQPLKSVHELPRQGLPHPF